VTAGCGSCGRTTGGGTYSVGVFQVAIAAAQISGINFGMLSPHMHGATSGEHLMHESTSWLLALGSAMIAAGIWPVAAIGVAAIAGVYALALVGYEAADALEGEVTAARAASHLPVLLGLMFALLVARERSGHASPRPSKQTPTLPTGQRNPHWSTTRSSLANQPIPARSLYDRPS